MHMSTSALVGHSESFEEFADPRQAHGFASARGLTSWGLSPATPGVSSDSAERHTDAESGRADLASRGRRFRCFDARGEKPACAHALP